MDYPKFIVSNQKEESISIQRVNKSTNPTYHFPGNDVLIKVVLYLFITYHFPGKDVLIKVVLYLFITYHFPGKDVLIKVVLYLFIGYVDAQLLKGVCWEVFETKYIKDSNDTSGITVKEERQC